MRCWPIGCALALLCACSEPDPPTQTIVLIDAKPSARTALSRVKVQAVGPADNREPSIETEVREWPIKLVFAPKNADASRRFALTIEARDGADKHLATLRLRTGFVPNSVRYALLMIHDGCTLQPSASCGEHEACNEWNAELDATDLGPSEQRPRTLDVTCKPNDSGEPPPDDEDPGTTAGSTAPQAGSTVPLAGSGVRPGTAGGAGAPPTRPVDPMGTCDTGYVRMGDVCIDVDECATEPCGENGRCQNMPGEYVCECNPGFSGESGACQDINECETDQGGCETNCENLVGSAACSCEGDDWLRGDRKACGNFAAATRVGYASSAQPMQPRFAFDAAGNGLAAWTQSDGSRTFLWTRRFVAGEGWAGFPTRIPIGDTGSASSPRVALDGSGRGLLAWAQSTDESRSDLWAARYDGTSFAPGEKIEADDAGSVYDPSLALDDGGNGFAVWTQSDGTRTRIRANRFEAASGWSDAQLIQYSMTDQALTPRLAIDAHGNATAGWTQAFISDTESTRVSAWLSRFDATLGRWRLPSVLDDSAIAGVPDTQLFEPTGHALTVWTRASGEGVSVWARSQASESSQNEPIQIGPESRLLAVIPRVALGTQGHGAAIWVQSGTTSIEVWANLYDGENDRWGEAQKLSQDGSTMLVNPHVAVDPSGDGFAVWSEIAGTSRVIRTARLQAGAGFVGQVALTMDQVAESPASSPPYLAVSAKGTAVAIWDVLKDGEYEVWSRTFE